MSVENNKKHYAKNNYKESNWNLAETTKYLVRLDSGGEVAEAGYFIHYLDGVFKKKVVEVQMKIAPLNWVRVLI